MADRWPRVSTGARLIGWMEHARHWWLEEWGYWVLVGALEKRQKTLDFFGSLIPSLPIDPSAELELSTDGIRKGFFLAAMLGDVRPVSHSVQVSLLAPTGKLWWLEPASPFRRNKAGSG